jgi:hypothetical protein
MPPVSTKVQPAGTAEVRSGDTTLDAQLVARRAERVAAYNKDQRRLHS